MYLDVAFMEERCIQILQKIRVESDLRWSLSATQASKRREQRISSLWPSRSTIHATYCVLFVCTDWSDMKMCLEKAILYLATSVATLTESVKSKTNSKWDSQWEFVDGGCLSSFRRTGCLHESATDSGMGLEWIGFASWFIWKKPPESRLHLS